MMKAKTVKGSCAVCEHSEQWFEGSEMRFDSPACKKFKIKNPTPFFKEEVPCHLVETSSTKIIWHRVGDLEVAPVEMWKRIDWDTGRTYCQSLGCFMPDQEQLQMILEDDAIRAVIDKKHLMNSWIWSSSKHSTAHAWVQRPGDGYQYGNSTNYGVRWVVPCRDAEVPHV